MISFSDISNYKNNNDWLPIVTAMFIAELLTIIIYCNLTDILKVWYDKFSFTAVLLDIIIVLIGFAIARYIYTLYFKPKFGFNIWIFVAVFLVIQIIHDILYYILISSIPVGTNKIIDFMKIYAKRSGIGAILGDSSIIITCAILASLLNNLPAHINIFISLVTFYIIAYLW